MNNKAKWEYYCIIASERTTSNEFMYDMEALGRNGWELVSVVQCTVNGINAVRAWFKRPIED